MDIEATTLYNSDMANRTQYNDEIRASAVVALEMAGYPDKEGALADTARELGIPHNTLRNWYHGVHNPPPTKLRQHVKKSMVEMLEDIAYKLIGSLPGKIPDATLQQTATTLGIVIDKRQLLTGQPTWRGEIVELLRNGKITPQDIINEFAGEIPQGLLESFGIPADEAGKAEVDSAKQASE